MIWTQCSIGSEKFLEMGEKLVYTASTSKSGNTLKACTLARLGQNAKKLWQSGRNISGLPKIDKKLVYTVNTRKSGTSLEAYNSAIFGQNAIKR